MLDVIPVPYADFASGNMSRLIRIVDRIESIPLFNDQKQMYDRLRLRGGKSSPGDDNECVDLGVP